MSTLKKNIIIILCVFCVFAVSADETSDPEQPCVSEDCSSAPDPRLIKIIKKRLDFYNQLIPEIYFIHLPNHDDWVGSIMALEMWLGYQATSLDFEHPPELAQDLLYVTVARVQKMLLYGHSAAFLFKVGVQAVSKRDITCVITMDPDAIAKHSNSASDFMLALPEETLKKISPSKRLEGLNLLEFIIDHEVAHCLDSHYNGPNPMSMKDFWGQYMHFQRELFSDIFAMISHMNTHGANSPFVENFINYRQLCLLNGDPGCCSANAIEKIKNIKVDKNTLLSISEKVQLASSIRKNLEIGYDGFENYYLASIEAMKQMNINPDENYMESILPEGKTVDNALVQKLINQTKKTYQLIFHEEFEANTKIKNQ